MPIHAGGLEIPSFEELDGPSGSCSMPDQVSCVCQGYSLDSTATKSCIQSQTEQLEIKNDVVALGDSSFVSYNKLKAVTFQPTSQLKYIYNQAFQTCEELAEITLPGSLLYIGMRTFANCKKLTEMEIPYGVPFVGYSLFNGCTSLQKVTIPACIWYVDTMAFYKCTSLTKVVCLGLYLQCNDDFTEQTVVEVPQNYPYSHVCGRPATKILQPPTALPPLEELPSEFEIPTAVPISPIPKPGSDPISGADSSHGGTLSSGEIAGITIGVIVFIAIIVILIIFLLFKISRKKEVGDDDPANNGGETQIAA